MAISKGKRFEIFKRDGFTCQYCGRRPPDVVLEVDHIHPQSKGGTDDDLNLITSCFDCNNGKRTKLLSDRSPKPDADLEYLAIQQEVTELKRYLGAKEERDEAVGLVVDALRSTWASTFDIDFAPTPNTFRLWLNRYSPDEIEEAILLSSRKFGGANPGWFKYNTLSVVKYIGGILRNRSEANGNGTYSKH